MIAAPAVPTVMVVDDQTLFRRGLMMLLQSDTRIKIVDDAASGAEAMEKMGKNAADIVLLDIKMPVMDGIETTRRIINAFPKTKVLILTTFENDGYVVQALQAGASGYLLKDSQPEAILSAMLAIMSGERVMTQSVADQFLNLLNGSVPKERYDGMTRREVEILKLLGQGLTNKQIAYRLKISEKTVRNHISNFYAKLGVGDRSQAVLYAVRKGLVEP
ncbi:MAG: response regulator transcription factor [Chloroflexi bacterium]|nr:MAG: response regulator transcription factor [Chloroflexota bacterium]TMC73065.1 MAG: response regulator transcription factor [Chloroflexota bacterium]